MSATDFPKSQVPDLSKAQVREQVVAQEDLVTFINSCFTCTNQQEFYGDKFGQAVSIDFLHQYILGNYRELYARTLSLGVNHFNQCLIIFYLLSTGKQTPKSFRTEENQLITRALKALPPQRVYKLFRKLRLARVNNRRTRALMKNFILNVRDTNFDAVKYRSKLRAAIMHGHLKLPNELSKFLFQFKSQKSFNNELFESFRKAHYSKKELFKLPATVALGFASQKGVAAAESLSRAEETMTTQEKLRFQKSFKKSGVKVKIDYRRSSLTRLILYWLSLNQAEKELEKQAIIEACQFRARRLLRQRSMKLGRVAAILDRSYSSSGSDEKKRRPLAIALATSLLLRHGAEEYLALWAPYLANALFETFAEELEIWPKGQTSLADQFVRALHWRAETIVIVSDGFENDPPGAVSELLRLYNQNLAKKHPVTVIHLNPVFDAGNFEPKTLGANIATVGVRNGTDVPTMLEFARFTCGQSSYTELGQYLEQCVAEFLSGA